MQLSAPQGDGAALRRHLESAHRVTGVADPRLAAASEPLPPAAALLWELYAVLSGTRQADGAITCREIEAWQRLSHVRLTTWEVDTLLAIDRAALAAGAEARSQQQQRDRT